MKKHIKKKFMFELELPDETVLGLEKSGKGISVEDIPKIKKIPDDMTTFLLTDCRISRN